jgi:hypothetical protein
MGLMRNMHLQKTPRRRSDTTAGVSEIIGAILMISLVVMAVAIVGILLFSQTTPQKIPNINFMTGSDNNNRLYLYHNGGDSLALGAFSVMVDGGIRNDYSLSDGSNEWSLGKNLILTNVSSGSHSIAIIYNGTGSGAVVLRSASSSIIAATVTDNPDVRTLTTYPPVIDVTQLMQNVTNNTINYYRENGTIVQPGGYIQLNITASGINSTIVTGNGLVQLYPGDTVRITPDSVSQGMVVFGIGDQIWEMALEKAVLTITNRTSNPAPYSGAINHSWITSYKDLQSTLILSTIPGSYYTELAVNNYPSYAQSQTFSSQVFNRTSLSTNVIQINNVKPTTIGLFVLRFDNKTKSTYFVGSASGYTVT